MKSQNIRLDGDVVLRLNQLKYKFQMKTQSDVVRRLVEIAMKIESADKFKEVTKWTAQMMKARSLLMNLKQK